MSKNCKILASGEAGLAGQRPGIAETSPTQYARGRPRLGGGRSRTGVNGEWRFRLRKGAGS